jgi:hypothetical protein
MERSIRRRHAALWVVGALAMLGVGSPAGAQRRVPRMGVAAQPRPEPQPGQTGRYPGANAPSDPRRRPGQWLDNRHQSPYRHGTTVIYVPVPGEYGYGYSQGVYYPQRSYGGAVYDANGRPLSSAYDQTSTYNQTSTYDQTSPVGGFSYTPDLGGSSYTVTDEGMMVVDFASGERRAFPSCAWQTDLRDPQGRPRTVFYQPSDYWMVLRPGQRGRVQGTPPASVSACYAVDSVGRMVLRY